MTVSVGHRLRMRSPHLRGGTWRQLFLKGGVRSWQFCYFSLLCVNLWGLGGAACAPAVAKYESRNILLSLRFTPAQLTLENESEPFQVAPETVSMAAIVSASDRAASPVANAVDNAPAAPSVLWLIVMPAIPLLWGGLIYLKRTWLARQDASLPAPPLPDPMPTQPTAGDISPPEVETEDR